mmetsp:Transcript_65136/g.190568  ORF Transcript_65136/g.190568 Transcript_65136/m.190568 type:complete len:223 (+) Transcript_65136:563-1231(+)
MVRERTDDVHLPQGTATLCCSGCNIGHGALLGTGMEEQQSATERVRGKCRGGRHWCTNSHSSHAARRPRAGSMWRRSHPRCGHLLTRAGTPPESAQHSGVRQWTMAEGARHCRRSRVQQCRACRGPLPWPPLRRLHPGWRGTKRPPSTERSLRFAPGGDPMDWCPCLSMSVVPASPHAGGTALLPGCRHELPMLDLPAYTWFPESGIVRVWQCCWQPTWIET